MKSFTFRLIALALVLVTLNGFTSLHAQSSMQEKGVHKMEKAAAVTVIQTSSKSPTLLLIMKSDS